MESVPYKLQLFGPPQLATATGDVIPVSRRARGILCYLALARDQKASRERLCALFWWDRPVSQARASLRQTLLQLRRALPPGGLSPLFADRDHVALDSNRVQTDLDGIETAETTSAFLAALRGIGSDRFADMLTFGEAHDEWRAVVGPAIEARLRTAVMNQLDTAEAANDQRAIIALADAWAVRDPLDEIVVARAIRAEILTDTRHAAELRFRRLSKLMENKLGVCPDAQLFEMLLVPEPQVRATDRASVKNATVASSPASTALALIARWPYAAVAGGLALLGVAFSLALGGMGPLGAAERPVIAVLPFTTVGGNTDDTIFAEGLAEEVMDGLAEDRRISVLGRATAMRLSTSATLRSGSRDRLGVTQLLQGRVRYSAGRSALEVEVELIDSRTGVSTWEKTVRLAAADVSTAEHDLVELICEELTGETPARPPSKGRPAKLNPGAYRKIVVARRHILSREGDRLIEARELAREAVELAPNWAEAHAVRSTAASLMQNYTDMPEAPLKLEARTAAERAIALDPGLSAAHEARSFVLEGVDAEQAMAEARKAVQLRPGNAEVRRRLAWLLRADGDLRQAAAELEAAIRIDPLWYLLYIDLGMTLSQTNEPADLIAWQGRHAILEPRAAERDLVLANMLLDTERAGEAAPIVARMVRTNPDLTYASLTWTDAMLALYAADAIPDTLFELNSSPTMVALMRGDLVGATSEAAKDGPGLWDDPEASVILGYALMSQGQPDRLRTLHITRHLRPDNQMRRLPQTLAFGRHPSLYPALAYLGAGDQARSRAIRKTIMEDVARLEQRGLAMPQSGVTRAALSVMAGDRSAAIDRLESTISAQWSVVCHGPIWIGSDPLFRGLAQEPRFVTLLERCRSRLNRQRSIAGLGPATLP